MYTHQWGACDRLWGDLFQRGVVRWCEGMWVRSHDGAMWKAEIGKLPKHPNARPLWGHPSTRGWLVEQLRAALGHRGVVAIASISSHSGEWKWGLFHGGTLYPDKGLPSGWWDSEDEALLQGLAHAHAAEERTTG